MEDALLNAIIVDDEAPARSELRYLLGEVGGVEVLAEAASVREAIEKMQSYPVDVLFLDVSMPEVTGIQFAEALQRLKNPPAVIFVTAYSEHALEGFKVNAVDYLVKPVENERLRQAVNRATEHVTLHMKATQSERIPVEKGGKKILIAIDSIRYVEFLSGGPKERRVRIVYNKFDDLYINTRNNEALIADLLRVNPDIEIRREK